MSFFDPQPEDWVDEQLRRVPVPPGLLAALRRIAVSSDDELDCALRSVTLPSGFRDRLLAVVDDAAVLDEQLVDVPVPTGLSQRLRTIAVESPATWTESRLDRELRDVEAPRGLRSRLRTIATETPGEWSDDRLDWEVRDVDSPEQLVPALSGIPFELDDTQQATRRPFARRRSVNWFQMATALSLVLVITISYASAIGGFLVSAYQNEFDAEPFVVVDAPWRGELEEAASRVDEAVFVAAVPESALPLEQLIEPFVPAPLSAPEAAPLLARDSGFSALGQFTESGVADPLMDVTLLDNSPITDVVPDTIDPLHRVGERLARGIKLPVADADALLFEVRYGVHAFVSPERHRELQSLSVPLAVGTSSYEEAWTRLLAGDLPRPHEIHPEEFLQAIDNDFAPALAGQLALRVAAGVSPFEASNSLALLQVGVQAGDLPSAAVDAPRRPVSLTFAVDTSGSMQRSQSLANTRRALLAMIDELEPVDRVSLVVFDEDAHVRLANVSVRDRQRLQEVIESLTADRSTNVGEGLRLACSVARNSPMPADGRRALVLLTDGLGELRSETITAIERNMAAAASDGVELEIVDLGPKSRTSDLLERLSNLGQGRLTAAADHEQIGWAIRETIIERPQVVARRARLTVRFNPETVASYRLVGHEAESIVGVNTAPLEVDLRANQSTAGLFELKLRPQGGGRIAEAELQWQDLSGREHIVRQPISRLQFAPSFLESQPSLQKAAVVAETAELLRGSPYVMQRGTKIEQLLSAADQIPRWYAGDESFVRFQQFLRLADRAGLR